MQLLKIILSVMVPLVTAGFPFYFFYFLLFAGSSYASYLSLSAGGVVGSSFPGCIAQLIHIF